MITFTLKTSDLTALLPLAADGDIRTYLNGVYVEACGCVVTLVATNGHVMGALRIDGGDTADGTGNFIIPRDLLAGVKSIRGISESTVTYDPITTLVTIDQYATKTTGKTLEGKYVDWRRVVPAKCTGEAAQFDTAYLAALSKVSKSLGCKRPGADVFVNGNGEAGGALVRLGTDDRFVGVLMAIRSSGFKAICPAWVTAGLDAKTALKLAA